MASEVVLVLPGEDAAVISTFSDLSKAIFRRCKRCSYKLPPTFPEGSKYAKYQGASLGLKLRMHPFAAALARCQLRGLEERNAAGVARVRSLNDRILHLKRLYEQTNGRTDMTRIHYLRNMLFIDESEAGMSRDVCVKALQAEGVRATAFNY